MAPAPGTRTPPTDVRVDARGGYFPVWPASVTLPEGGVVEWVAGTAARRGRFHLGLAVDKAIVRLDRLRWPPGRHVAWVAETPAMWWVSRVPRHEGAFRRVLTCDAELLARGEPYERFHFGTSHVEPSFGPKTRLVSMVASSLTSLPGHRFRWEALQRVRGRGVEAFGRGHREIASKHEALGPFAFSIAMENCRRDEYFTEKLVDCFRTETVPVYWGFPSLHRLFDPRGVLSFETPAELDEILDGLSFDLYERLRPHVLENRRRVEALELDSPGLWRRLARVLSREAAGLAPVPRPWTRRYRTARVLLAALGPLRRKSMSRKDSRPPTPPGSSASSH